MKLPGTAKIVRNVLPLYRRPGLPPAELAKLAVPAEAHPAPRRPFDTRRRPGGLTVRDVADGAAYYVVGVRPDGARLVLDEAESADEAERRRGALAQCEGYTEIVVERAGG